MSIDLQDRWQARYGSAAELPPLPAQGAAVLDHLLAHRSVRAYADAPLPEQALPWIIGAAQSAPSSSNLQAWSVVEVADPARKGRLARWAHNQAHIHAAPLLLVWLADLSRLDRTAQRRGERAGANHYLEMFLVAAIDAALAAQNAVVAAEALGLGTVYIGALRNHPDEVAAELGLPEHVFPLFGLCVGRPDETRPAAVKPRLAQPVVWHRERYGLTEEAEGTDEAAQVEAYDHTLQAFQRGQGLPPVPWSQQASGRVAGPGSLSGRHELRRWVEAQGLALE